MADDDEWPKLPTEDKVVHKSWKARVAGYEEACKSFRLQTNEKSDEFSKYLGILKKFVIDTNAVAQEKGLLAVFAFVENSAFAGRVCGEVVSGIVAKVLNARPKTKQSGIDICLMYIELEKQEVVLEELMKGLENKQPKIIVACTALLSQALSEFGSKVITVKPLVKAIPKLLDHSDKTVRAEAKNLAIEVYRWIRDAIRTPLQGIKPVVLKELDEEWTNLDATPPQPTRFTKTEQAKRAKAPPPVAAEGPSDAGDSNVAAVQQVAAVDPYDLLDPVDILAQLPKDFFEQVAHTKWQERKSALEDLEKLTNHPKLEAGQYGDVMGVLKKVISKDSNVMIVAVASRCVVGLAKGLRKKFTPYAPMITRCILEKFKEKKLNVVIPLRDAIDAVHKTTNLDAMLEDVLEVLESKNPSIKEEICKFVSRVFAQSTQATLPKQVLKPLCALLIKKMDDTAGPVRDAAAEALGTAMKAVGQKAIAPYVDQLDKIKAEKVMDWFNKVELVGGPAAAVPVKQAAPASAPAAAKPAAAPAKQPAKTKATKKPKEGKTTKAAVKKGVKGGGGGAKKAAKKTNPFELDLEEPTEPELHEGVVEEKSIEIFSEEIVKQIASTNWKERLSAVEEMTRVVHGLTEGNLPSQVLVRTLTKKPGLKDNNFQVLKLKCALLGKIAQMSKPFSRRSALYAIEGLIEKIADIKVMEVVKDTLKIFAENISLNYVSLKAAKIGSEAKNPKIAAESLNWMNDALKEFGFKIDLKPHLTFIKTSLQHVNPAIRGAAVQFLGTLFIYVGATLRVFFEDEKPALLKQIDAEFEKMKDEKPPAPTRKLIDDEGNDEGNDDADADGVDGEGGDSDNDAGQVNLADLVERFDVSDKITDELIQKLGDKNWKIRNEGLEGVTQIISDAKFIKPNLGELPAALKGRLGDSNKNLVKATLAICKSLVEAGGPKMTQHSGTILPGIIGAYVDSKPQIRAAATEALDAWHGQIGFLPLIEHEILVTSMKLENPNIRSGLLGWLETKLPNEKKLPNDFNEIIFPLLKCLEDRNPEVRKNAQAVLPLVMAHTGYDAMSKCAAKFEPTSKTTVQGLLEKAREVCVPIKSVKSTKATSSKPSKSTSSSSTKVVEQKQVQDKEPAAGKAEKTKASSKKTAASAVTRKGKGKVEEDEGPSLVLKVGKEQRFKDEKTLKVLKWNFSTPREECIQQLKDQMAPCVSSSLHIQLFHSDFKFHLQALATMTAAVLPDKDGSLPYKDALLESSDLFLKWVTLRFFDTNTSVLLKSLEFLNGLFQLISSEGCKLHEYEAVSFIPYLVNKIGDPKDNVRKSIHSLMKLITNVYPASKLFSFLMDGLQSKNSKTRMECLEELGHLISKFSLNVCQPTPQKALKEIAAQIGDRDKGVRSSALNALVEAYRLIGDQMYKMIGRISDKDQSYLDERIKRAGKAQPANAAAEPKAGSAAAARKDAEHAKSKADAEMEALKATARSLLAKTAPAAPPEKKEFMLDLDDIEKGVSVLKGSDLELISVNVETTSDVIPKQFASAAARKSTSNNTSAVKNVAAILDWTIAQISSSDILTSMEALYQLEEVFKKRKEEAEVAKKVDQYLLQCLVQYRMLFSKHVSNEANDKDTLLRLLKLLLGGSLALFSHRPFAQASTRSVLKDVMANYVDLLHNNSMMQFSDFDQAIRSVNAVMLRVIENTDHNCCMGALLNLLQDCIANSKTPTKYTELVLKCIWKMMRQLPRTIMATKVDVLLEDCEQFLRVFPSSYWKKATDATPVTTIKSLLLLLIKTCGQDILNEFGLIKDPETSELVAYVRRNAKQKASSVPSADRAKGSETNTQDQVDNKTSPTPRRSTSDLLIDIFQKIGSKEKTEQGLSDLYDFKQKYPDEDLSPFIKNTTQFFQNYIERGLKNIEGKRKQEETEKDASSTATGDTTKYLDRLKELTMNYKESESKRLRPVEKPAESAPKEDELPKPEEPSTIGDIVTETEEKPTKKVDVDDLRKRLERIKAGNVK